MSLSEELRKALIDLKFCTSVRGDFCKGCSFYAFGDDCLVKQNEAVANHIETLVRMTVKLSDRVTESEEQNRWIPVTEGPPKEFVSVLVCIPSDDPLPTVKEAYLAEGMWVTKAGYYPQQEVTHWRPMPEGAKPPEVEHG